MLYFAESPTDIGGRDMGTAAISKQRGPHLQKKSKDLNNGTI